MLAGTLLLGGLLPMGPATRAKWAPSGAWRMPVGDPYAMSFERNWGLGPVYLVRSLEWDGSRASHQGADLGSGMAGAPVRAAAAGLVVKTADRGLNGGYGTIVVLAHRLPEGEVAYSVYAHLRVGSIRVKPGQFVPAGTMLGRGGATGRANGPHLHFEVRTTREPEERWEFGNVEDPLAFVEERLPAHRADSTGVAAFLEWGEFTALIPSGAQGDDPLTRERWWRMLAAAARGPMLDPMLPPTALRDSLVRLKVLRSGAKRRDPDGVLEWSEFARALNYTRRTGLRTGRGPLRRSRHDGVCGDHFGEPAPSLRTAALSGRPGTPTLTDAVLLLADVAGPAGEPARPAKPVPASPVGSAPTAAAGPARAKSAGATAVATPRPTRADSLAARSRPARATVATRASAGTPAGRRPTRADSLAARARSTTSKAVAGSRAGGETTARRPGAAKSTSTATSAARSGASSARPDPQADAASRLVRAKPPADSLARRSRATAAADTQARASRARSGADSLAAPRSAPPAASASADSSDRAPAP